MSAYRHLRALGTCVADIVNPFLIVSSDLPRYQTLARYALQGSGPHPMMKIEIQEAGESVVLKVEGRLAGACAAELENCWNVARATHPGSAIFGRPEKRHLRRSSR